MSSFIHSFPVHLSWWNMARYSNKTFVINFSSLKRDSPWLAISQNQLLHKTHWKWHTSSPVNTISCPRWPQSTSFFLWKTKFTNFSKIHSSVSVQSWWQLTLIALTRTLSSIRCSRCLLGFLGADSLPLLSDIRQRLNGSGGLSGSGVFMDILRTSRHTLTF